MAELLKLTNEQKRKLGSGSLSLLANIREASIQTVQGQKGEFTFRRVRIGTMGAGMFDLDPVDDTVFAKAQTLADPRGLGPDVLCDCGLTVRGNRTSLLLYGLQEVAP